MELKEALSKTIVDYISKGKIGSLERAFKQDAVLSGYIQDYWNSHNDFMKKIDMWCKKYPESCKKKV